MCGMLDSRWSSLGNEHGYQSDRHEQERTRHGEPKPLRERYVGREQYRHQGPVGRRQQLRQAGAGLVREHDGLTREAHEVA